MPIQKLSPNFEESVGVEANLYQYNGKELNEDFGLHWMDYGARWYDPQNNRWGQIDPLAEKYLNISPYAYVANNPIIFLDPNGMQNMIYLCFDPSSNVSQNQRKEIQIQMQALFDDWLGVNTVEVKDFDQVGTKILSGEGLDTDNSDSIIAFGSVDALKSIADNCFYSCESSDRFKKDFIGSAKLNPEHSENNGNITGQFVGLDAAELNKRNNDMAGFIGTSLGVHGVGHNAGMGDVDYLDPKASGNNQNLNPKGIMSSGKAKERMTNDGVDATEFINCNNNTTEITRIEKKFKHDSPRDNYLKNMKKNNLIPKN